ncbi:unnamed protein product, partial [Gulo gulo]
VHIWKTNRWALLRPAGPSPRASAAPHSAAPPQLAAAVLGERPQEPALRLRRPRARGGGRLPVRHRPDLHGRLHTHGAQAEPREWAPRAALARAAAQDAGGRVQPGGPGCGCGFGRGWRARGRGAGAGLRSREVRRLPAVCGLGRKGGGQPGTPRLRLMWEPTESEAPPVWGWARVAPRLGLCSPLPFFSLLCVRAERLGAWLCPPQDSPSNKLLYAKEISTYKKMVEDYYKGIRQMVQVSDQDMNTYLAEISRAHTDSLNTLVALHQLYQYTQKYYDEIINALEEDPAAQKMQLAFRLQQIAAALENKVTDL